VTVSPLPLLSISLPKRNECVVLVIAYGAVFSIAAVYPLTMAKLSLAPVALTYLYALPMLLFPEHFQGRPDVPSIRTRAPLYPMPRCAGRSGTRIFIPPITSLEPGHVTRTLAEEFGVVNHGCGVVLATYAREFVMARLSRKPVSAHTGDLPTETPGWDRWGADLIGTVASPRFS
jgi:hypothetical protein